MPIVAMVGEFDVATAGVLSERLSVAIALDESDLVVDLSGVSFMDAATISVLIGARVFLGEHGRSLVLRDPSRCARRILGVCDMRSLIERELSGPVEPPLVGALQSWVAVPPIATTRDNSPPPSVVPAEALAAAEVTTEPILALADATPTASRPYAASPPRGRM